MNEEKSRLYKKWIKIILIAIVAIVAVTMGIRFVIGSRHDVEKEKVSVSAAAPATGSVSVYTEQIGTVTAEERSTIICMSGGEVLKVNFNVGDQVKKDQELCVIDSDAIEGVRLALDAAKITADDAKTNLERMQVLFASGAISQAALEQAQSAAQAAQIAYEGALQKYEIQDKYTNIKAPVSGTVEYKNVAVHDMAMQGSTIAVISSGSGKKVTFGVAEDSVNAIRIGEEVRLYADGKEYTGNITEVNNMIGDNGLYSVTAAVKDGGDIRNNAKVVVSVIKKRAENAMTIPISAIYHSGDKAFVYVLQDGKAVRKFVTTGVYDEEKIEIVSGLKDTDKVIYTWNKELYDGAEVNVKAN